MKRGIAHIEVIVSFILFIGFLFFGLYFFNPINTTRVLDSTLYYASDGIAKNVSTNAYVYSMTIERQGPLGDVVYLPIGALGKSPQTFRGIRVENAAGQPLPVYYDSGRIYFKRASSGAQSGGSESLPSDLVGETRFVKIVLGDFATTQHPEITEAIQDGELHPEDYSISSSDDRTPYGEDAAHLLETLYHDDYPGLKEELNLPSRVDFSFTFSDAAVTIVNATRPIPDGIEVYTKNERVEFVTSDGEVTFVDFIVRVW